MRGKTMDIKKELEKNKGYPSDEIINELYRRFAKLEQKYYYLDRKMWLLKQQGKI